MKSIIVNAIALWFAVSSSVAMATGSQNIYLSRHAEVEHDGTRDPNLSSAGLTRANNLATFFKARELTAIYSSPYKRTQQTAAAAAKLLNIKVITYDPSDLKAFAAQLKNQSGNYWVVGHSNTTPALAAYLGSDSVSEIDDSEFDRLYRLTKIGVKLTTDILRSVPIQRHALASNLPIDAARFFEGKLEYQLLMKDEVMGFASHRFSTVNNQWVMEEKTQLEKYKIDEDIKVIVDSKTLSPLSMVKKSNLDNSTDIALEWDNEHVSGHSLTTRADYLPQGKLAINELLPRAVIERNSAIMSAHLVAIAPDQTIGIKWYDGYNNQLKHIDISYLGEQTITVPAGMFKTYKLSYQGGAPSQVFYISQDEQPKIIQIEVVHMPWVYQLVKASTKK